MINTKHCTRCGTVKQAEQFSKCAKSRDGLQPWCRDCARIAGAAWSALNRDKKRASHDKWAAANPDKAKAASAAWARANPDKVNARGAKWRAANPEKVIARISRWQKANPEKHNASCARWSAANPDVRRINRQNRRARKIANGGRLSPGLTEKLFKLQRGKCACCHVSLDGGNHLDHVIPLALEGPNEDWNMQLLCGPCNLSKGAKHPVEFMQQRGFLL